MKTALKNLPIGFLFLLLVACQPQDSAEAKKQQLEKYREEMAGLKLKIRELEHSLKNDSLNENVNGSKTLVKIQEMQAGRFEHFIEVVGAVEAVREAWISPETGGQIRQILVKEGDRVRVDQALARLNSDVTENSIAEIKTQLELASVVFKKQSSLWEQNIGSEIEYLQAKSTKESLESRLKTMEAQQKMSLITAPVNGIVEEVMQKEGELAAPGMMLMRIINLDEMYVKTDIAESHLPSLRMNEEVSVRFPTWPELEFQPPIHRIGSAIDGLNRTVQVSVKVKNTPDHKLRPNLLAQLRFLDFESDSALVVPSICIKQDIHGPYLYCLQQDPDGLRAKKVYISTGMVYQNQTMITSGLKPGDKVIVEGYNLVTDQSEVRL
jgi:RND family efflux transporter MFP subunit